MSVDEELVAHLHPSLRVILELELRAGNEVQGWDESEWTVGLVLLVRLARPFARRYEEFADVVFVPQNDPHYWGDEISVRDGHQGLSTPLVPPKAN